MPNKIISQIFTTSATTEKELHHILYTQVLRWEVGAEQGCRRWDTTFAGMNELTEKLVLVIVRKHNRVASCVFVASQFC